MPKFWISETRSLIVLFPNGSVSLKQLPKNQTPWPLGAPKKKKEKKTGQRGNIKNDSPDDKEQGTKKTPNHILSKI